MSPRYPRMDDTTYKYPGFEMMKGEVARKEMMLKLEERIREKFYEPTKTVDVFEARNWKSPQEELRYSRQETGSTSSTRT